MLTFMLSAVLCTFITYNFLPHVGITEQVQLFFTSPIIGVLVGYLIALMIGFLFGKRECISARYAISSFNVLDGSGFTSVNYADDSAPKDLERFFYSYEIEINDGLEFSVVRSTKWVSPSSMWYLGLPDSAVATLILSDADHTEWFNRKLSAEEKEVEDDYT